MPRGCLSVVCTVLVLLMAASTSTPVVNLPESLPDGTTLLQRFIRAVGGEREIREISNLTAKGTITLPGQVDSGTFQWAVADGDRCRFSVTFPGLGNSVFGSNGTTGWESFDLDGVHEVRKLSADDVDRRRRTANWFELALTLPERARSVETIGPATFDGTPVYEVRMVDASGRVQHLFIDQKTYLLNAVRLAEEGPIGPADVTIRFRDWKPVASILLFRTVSIDHSGIHMKLRFETVSTEVIPNATFQPPPGLNPEDD